MVQAAPRPIEDALPAGTRSALFVHEFGTELEPAVDALERILSPGDALDFIDTAPLPAMALQSLSGEDEMGLDRRGGLALFRVEGGTVAVGVVAVKDAAKAMTALAKTLSRQGASAGKATENGSTLFRMREGLQLAAFTRGGFLYLVMPDTELIPDTVDDELAPVELPDVVAAAAELRTQLQTSLGKAPLYEQLRSRVAGKGVQLFITHPVGRSSSVQGLLLAATFDDAGTHMDGFLATQDDVLHPTDGKGMDLLSKAPAGAAFVISTRVQSAELSRWLGGGERSIAEKLSGVGLAPSILATAFSGEMQAAFYLDPELLMIDALSQRQKVGPIGTIFIRAGVVDSKLASALSSAWLKAHGTTLSRIPEKKDLTRFKAVVEGQPVDVRISRDRFEVQAGPALAGRKSEDLIARYSKELPDGAFGPGHVSAVIDLAQVRSELAVPRRPGDEDFDTFQRVVAQMVSELTSLDRLALDLAPELGGARVTVELRCAPAKGQTSEKK